MKFALDHARDIVRGHGGADPARGKRGLLRVQRADDGPLLVIEHRMITCARQMIFGEFTG